VEAGHENSGLGRRGHKAPAAVRSVCQFHGGCGAPEAAFGLDLALHNAELSVAIDIEKEVIIGDDALDDRTQDIRAKQAEFFAIDDGVHAMLESLYGAESAHGTAQQNKDGVPSRRHGHLLNELQR